jgi:methylated-DNA-[protein]-cysteine S-methyltransferase
MDYTIFLTKFGYITLCGKDNILYYLLLNTPKRINSITEDIIKKRLNLTKLSYSEDIFLELKEKLRKYFEGERVEFNDCKYELTQVSEFTKKVLNFIRKIPYGRTMTYGELARKLSTSPRAAAKACSKNPIPIIIPCHRVVGKNSLGGFSCGIEYKEKLLLLEAIKNKIDSL